MDTQQQGSQGQGHVGTNGQSQDASPSGGGTVKGMTADEFRAFESRDAFMTIRDGRLHESHYGLVPAGRGRFRLRIVLRDRATGNLTLQEYGPDVGTHEIAGFDFVLPHPGKVKPGGEKWEWGRPDLTLHQVVYGFDNVGNADTIANRQHGGVVVTLFAIIEGRLRICVIRQKRKAEVGPDNPEGWTEQTPRGNLDPGVGLEAAVSDEVAQEVGAFMGGKQVILPGDTVNVDTAWFSYYLRQKQPNGPVDFKGVDYAAREVPAGLLEPHPDRPDAYRFKPGVVKPREVDGKVASTALKEVIEDGGFYLVEQCLGLRCGMSIIGVSRTMAWLMQTGRLALVAGQPVTVEAPTRPTLAGVGSGS